jgi:hypothetical protein
LIGAYRDNEVGPAHPLTDTLEKMRRSEACLQEVVLGPLPSASLTQFVAGTVRQSVEAVAPLAQLVYAKTEGNPFFAIHFLTTLYTEGLLLYSDGSWQWDLVAIRRQGFTDNVVELMLGKLNRLPVPTRNALTQAACLAGTVDAATLAILTDRTEDQLHEILRRGLDGPAHGSPTVRFCDRVQGGRLRPAGRRPNGRSASARSADLLSQMPPDRLTERSSVVGQLNHGTSLITSADGGNSWPN